MRILFFSLGPIFKNIVHGGSQKALCDIAIGLAKRGHEITILCPEREDNKEEFYLYDKVNVKPIIPLKGTFPAPYEVSPYKIYKACKIIQMELSDFDVFYLHDGQLNIEYLKGIIPTVISLRDFCYTETLLGALNFEQEYVIVNSDYTYQCLMDSFARINPYLKNRVEIIYNGYELKDFHRKKVSEDFLHFIGISVKTFKVIGFPHRPDLSKGFIEAIRVLQNLVKEFGNVKMLIPEYVDRGISSRANNTYAIIDEIIKEKQLENYVVFHKWIPHYYMDQYYSLCDVVLCIGDFSEAFSNVSVESLMCQTPVIATNSSTYRTMPIKQFLDIVDFGDVEETVDKIIDILSSKDYKKDRFDEALEFIRLNLNMKKCIDNYEKVFIKVSKKDSINIKSYNLKEQNKFESFHLAPWCYYLKDEIYNDYEHTIYTDSLNGIFKKGISSTIHEMENAGVERCRIEDAINYGIIISDVI